MKKKVVWLVVSCLVVLALLAASCGGGEEKPAAEKPAAEKPVVKEEVTPKEEMAPAPVAVDISGFAFKPATITVVMGTTITWTNRDSVAHTVSSVPALFDSGNLGSGATFSYTFNQIGTFDYHCKIHPSMTGKVIVQ